MYPATFGNEEETGLKLDDDDNDDLFARFQVHIMSMLLLNRSGICYNSRKVLGKKSLLKICSPCL